MSKKPTTTNRRKNKSSFEQSRSFDELKQIFPCNVEKQRSALYKFVYSSTYSLVIVMLLLASFLLQGIESVYADELEVTEEEVAEVEEKPVEKVETVEDTKESESVEDVSDEVESEEETKEMTLSENDDSTEDDTSQESETEKELNNDTEEDETDNSDTQADLETNTGEETQINDDVETDIEENNTSTSTNSNDEVVNENEEDDDISGSNDDTINDNATTTSDVDNDGVGTTTSPVNNNGTTTSEVIEDGDSLNEDVSSTTATTTENIISNEGSDSANEDQSESVTEDNEVSDNNSPSINGGDEDVSSDDSNNETGQEQAASTGEILGLATTSVSTESSTYLTHDNEYTFDKTNCVAVGGGTYHCSTDSGVLRSVNEQVFAEKGRSGNYEIFIRTDEGIEKITDNYYEDTSPKYDEGSKRLVWQRLIDGRYHIVVYDLKDKEEKQLTSGSQNHMEPAIAGDNIVWQQWDGGDWEIVLYDGEETKQLTNNDVQDLAPVIEDEYVVWTAIGKNEQLVYVYSLKSGSIQTITDHEGGAIANPRFVLVYDTKFDNGDIITKGFDPETGLSASLAAVPTSPPVDIPPPDSTGETKALIQNKSLQREDFSELEIDDNEPVGSSTTSTSNPLGTDTQGNDLVIASTTDQMPPVEPLVLTEFDLIIDDQEAPTTTEDVGEVATATATST